MTTPFDPSTVMIVPSGIVADAPSTLTTAGMPQLASDDGRMALLGADVDDDTGGGEEEGRPRRIGDGRDEDVVGLEVAGFGGVGDDSRRSGRHAGADAEPRESASAGVGPGAFGPQLPRGRRWDLALEPERWDAVLEVASPGPPFGDDVGDGVRVAAGRSVARRRSAGTGRREVEPARRASSMSACRGRSSNRTNAAFVPSRWAE